MMIPKPARTLVVDVPWKFDDALPGPGRGASKKYPCMPVVEIEAFPLPLMALDSWLFFWRVSSMVEEAYRVIRAWGFEPAAELVWNKVTAAGGKPWFGMGRTVRQSHEVCVIARRGRPERLSASVRSTFTAPVPVDDRGHPVHSMKPDEFYGLVETLAPGPYVELFSRRERPGWACFGNEVPEAYQPGFGAASWHVVRHLFEGAEADRWRGSRIPLGGRIAMIQKTGAPDADAVVRRLSDAWEAWRIQTG